MRIRTFKIFGSITMLLGLTTAVGCFDFFSDDSLYLQEGPGTTSGTGTGGSGGAPPECIPNQTDEAPDDECGVFVAAATGSDANPGTKELPFATLSKAIDAAQGKPVYACADDAEPFVETVGVTDSVHLFGGMDCTSWKYAPGSKTKWTAAPDALVLRVANGVTIALDDMAIEAANALNKGGSSIAVLAQAGATVAMARCDVTAGDGAEGTTPEAPTGSGMAGVVGGDGTDGCDTPTGKIGGDGGALTCGGTDVGGGPGGTGLTASTGGSGSPGQPETMAGGDGGSGQKESPPAVCTSGGNGEDGPAGAPGAGATGMGSLSASGFQGPSGADGATPGKPGQGGGGGGGASKCGTNAGPSAGGGGSGGCGGTIGKGGGAGGASIALVSLGASWVFTDVKLVSKNGGAGGDGGPGQPGGDGGDGGQPGMGNATSMACAGGKGGKGGPGGRGGGGRGGHSIGIAFSGEAPDTTGATITIGTTGNGGAGDGATGIGAAGVAAQTQAF